MLCLKPAKFVQQPNKVLLRNDRKAVLEVSLEFGKTTSFFNQ
jgi:hypothetical protein